MRHLLTGFLLMSLAVGASGQVLNRRSITSIVVENKGPGRVDESYVTAHTRVRAGDEFVRRRVNRDVKALLDTGLFSAVSARLETSAGGLRLSYDLTNKYKLAKIAEVVGLDVMRASKAHNTLDLDQGEFIDEQIAGVRAQALIKEYADDFYPDANVTWLITEVSKDLATATVVFTVDEGRRARVSDIVYEGNAAVPTKTVHSLYREVRWYNPFSWFRRSSYAPSHLESRRIAILKHYRNLGFLDAVIPFPDVTRNEEGQVVLQFNISEGVQYRFDRIALRGSGLDVFPEAVLTPFVAAEPGSIAGQGYIDARAKALRDYFGSRGYIDTRVKTVINPSPEKGELDVLYDVTEGDLFKVRNILIQGNTRTRDKVIRRELLVYPGEIFNEVKVSRSERIVQNLGFFSTVRSEPIATHIPDEKDLVFKVEEKRTGQFMMGAGFSSIEQIVGFVEVSQANFDIAGWPNFMGGGQKLKVRAEFGSKRNDLEVSFVEPWFLDRKLSFGVDAFRSDFSYTDYDEVRTGGALTLGKKLPGPNRVSVRYRLEKTEIKDIADTNAYVYVDAPHDTFFFTSDEDRTRSAARLTLTHDTRNNPFVPTRGNRVSVFAEVAGGPFGFDTDEFHWGMRGKSYFPLWFNHVLSFRGRAEVIEGFGDTDEVPLVDRLFLGGGKTLRGYEFRDVGPKVVPADSSSGNDSHRSAGGQTLAVASAEYTIPIIDSIRFAGFFDVGNVWRDAYDFDFGETASSMGIGLRFDLPGFPIRIDRAWSVETDDDLTDVDKWVLWIGF
ncbi:MAG: outer membrane protein assembly factor BamA [Kiritimatiellae bacterium]|nr:outer membrane protein assembly factor BamA [Kiritimatiellia bacterium]